MQIEKEQKSGDLIPVPELNESMDGAERLAPDCSAGLRLLPGAHRAMARTGGRRAAE